MPPPTDTRIALLDPGTLHTLGACIPIDQLNVPSPNGTFQIPIDEATANVLDVRWFGSVPYACNGTVNPYGAVLDLEAIDQGDFSIWFRAVMPDADTDRSGGFIITTASNISSSASAFELRLAPGAFGFVSRSTGGSSAPGESISDGATLDSSTVFAGIAGELVDIVVTRSGGIGKVYLNGADVTSSFTLLNSVGWGKALGGGGPLKVLVGKNNAVWFWKKPIHRLAVFDHALSAEEALDPSAVADPLVDWEGTTLEEPADATPGIQAAIDYAAERGGGIVVIPAGQWWIKSTIRLKPCVTVRGAADPAHYPGLLGIGLYAPTQLVASFGAVHDIFVARQSDARPEVLLTRRDTPHGTMSNNYMHAAVHSLAIMGHLGTNSKGFWLDRVVSVLIRNIVFAKISGRFAYAMGCNGIVFEGIVGSGFHGIAVLFSADVVINHCFIDGTYGPPLYFRANKSMLADSVFDVHFEPTKAGAFGATFAGTVTVDATSNTFTKADHRLRIGDLVRFKSTGTLPAPLSATTDYFVSAVPSADTFKISTEYVDEDTNGGALNGVSMDISDAGSGVHTLLEGPVFNVILRGDRNSVCNLRCQYGWEGNLLIEEGIANALANVDASGGAFDNNAAGIANVSITGFSSLNSIVNLIADRRVSSSHADIGVYLDSTSTKNTILGLIAEAGSTPSVPTPVSAPADNDIRLRSVSSGGLINFAPWGVNGAATQWTFGTDGTLRSRNTANTNAAWRHDGVYSGGVAWFNTFSTTAGQGVRFWLVRSNAAAPETYGALGNGHQIFEIVGGGYYGATANDLNSAAVGIEALTYGAWTSGDTPVALLLKITPRNSGSRQVSAYHGPEYHLFNAGPAAGGTLTQQMAIIYRTDATKTAIDVVINGTNRSIRAGANGTGPGGIGKALYVDNI